jgi:mycothiol synthase
MRHDLSPSEAAYVVRSFAPEADLPRLARLMAAVEAADHDGEDWSEETLRGQLTLPGHAPQRDRWVALAPNDPDSLLGWGFVWVAPGEPVATLAGAVHPEARGRGIGTDLLDRTLAQARTLGATTCGAYAGSTNKSASAFLLRRGFVRVSANTLLRIAAEDGLPDPHFPAGYSTRAYAAQPDPDLFLQATNQCFAGLWGHHHVTADFAAEWLGALDPHGNFFALGPSGDLAGVVRAERYGAPVGYVDAPGVAPAHRGAGLHVPLLLTAAQYLRQHASVPIEVESWGDAPETLAAYEKLGFRVVRQAIAYERPTE